ncbi:CRISPR-associated protein Cmr3 [Oscillatoriales cyanobacterium LEGE 11467]|uniref:CRISPR-associated protein Cmr3 n=1 Tax=Zarconia navalis LEGE 11467 TaxID=1828826 RepID=A0A928Z781_9CYAN|nr:type III-B CRISPR module-associated protein Cmr3 [Zarconia navalis]MBE9040270.1 CRISPR-associated protein Cmr3 [Zarconia navalis LEGE 11467]
MPVAFNFLIAIEPLGWLSSGAGQFATSGNISVRTRTSFPPHTPTLSGLYALNYNDSELEKLQLAGPFWAKTDDPQNFYIPTPFNYSIADWKINDRLIWNSNTHQWQTGSGVALSDLPPSPASWISIHDWHQPQQTQPNPWIQFPVCHSRLKLDERQLALDEQSNLFQENVIQMNPATCLVYLANLPLPNSWYRFGGESHIVNLDCLDLAVDTQQLLNQRPGKTFTLISPTIWGSNRLSYTEPINIRNDEREPIWDIEAILTQPPSAFRHRLGGKLSRGRYAVPAGTVYVLNSPLMTTWQEWPEAWFPSEGYSFKRWGCGLALPLVE